MRFAVGEKSEAGHLEGAGRGASLVGGRAEESQQVFELYLPVRSVAAREANQKAVRNVTTTVQTAKATSARQWLPEERLQLLAAGMLWRFEG